MRKMLAAPLTISVLLFSCAAGIALPVVTLAVVEQKTPTSLQEQMVVTQGKINATQEMINATSRKIDEDLNEVGRCESTRLEAEKLRALATMLCGMAVNLFGSNSVEARRYRAEIGDLDYVISMSKLKVEMLKGEISRLESERLGYIQELHDLSEALPLLQKRMIFLQERVRLATLVTISALIGLAVFIILALKEKGAALRQSRTKACLEAERLNNHRMMAVILISMPWNRSRFTHKYLAALALS